MTNLKKKGERGAARNYISRTRAIRKLQLSLADFRRLCILKGIYPRQPNNKKKAAGKSGNTAQTFYYAKDIQYMLHEPLMDKMRQHKAFIKKLSRAMGKREDSLVKKLEENRPQYSLNHLVKER
jgi:pescadillo protein